MSSTEADRTLTRARSDKKELSRFGLIVGGIFGLIGLWPLVMRGAGARWWSVILSAALIVPALAAPRLLGPAHQLWMRMADGLAWLNTRILLSIVFFALVTPMSVIMRWLGWDPMRRGFEREAATYRVNRQSRPPSHMVRQF